MYKYAQISSDKETIVRFYDDYPNIYNDNGEQIKDNNILENLGIIPVIYSQPLENINSGTTYIKEKFVISEFKQYVEQINTLYTIENSDADNFKYHKIINDNQSSWIFDDELNIVKNMMLIILKTLNEVLNEKKEYINTIRDGAIFSNFSFEFPNNQNGIIQIRNEIDLRNIFLLTLVDKETYIFRDEANINHELNPEEFQILISVIITNIQDTYSKSWVHKDNIQNIIKVGHENNKLDSEIINDLIAYEVLF